MNRIRRPLFAIISVTFLLSTEIILLHLSRRSDAAPVISPAEKPTSVRFLAFGDVNLGRTVGQKILKIDTHYPFQRYDIKADSADIVFANLECQVSDQNGETGHPKFNLIFTAPPEAVTTLKASGIDIVSTANNHAVDYGIDALKETIDRLEKANIPFVGTSNQKETLYRPLIYEKNNIKFAIFAVSSFVNMTFKGWRDHVAVPDTVILKDHIEKIRDSVDIVIVSYHGGVEYIDKPIEKVRTFADWCVRNGVNIFLGHHPHVTYGITEHEGSYIVHSLGNFIFFQPQHYWTQRSYGVKFLIQKDSSGATVSIDRLLPVNVSMQTQRLTDTAEVQKLIRRTQQLSNIDLTQYWN